MAGERATVAAARATLPPAAILKTGLGKRGSIHWNQVTRTAKRDLLRAREHSLAGVDLPVPELRRDAEQLVILGDAVAARKPPRLDLAGVGRHRHVGDECVLRLARSVGDDRAIAGVGGVADRVERLGHGADLIEL